MENYAIIIDIDGTLANIDHRRSKLMKTNNWHEFNSAMEFDTINHWCLEIINRFQDSYEIILVTGRKKQFEKVTMNWLFKNKVNYDHIYFREDSDYRADELVKTEIYNKHIRDNYKVLFVVDDRSKVVHTWREIGLICLQCADGNF